MLVSNLVTLLTLVASTTAYINRPEAVFPNWDRDRKNVFTKPSGPRHTELKRSAEPEPNPEPAPYINNPAAVIPGWRGDGFKNPEPRDAAAPTWNKRYINNPSAVFPNWNGKAKRYINNPAAVFPNWKGDGTISPRDANAAHAPAKKRYINNPGAVFPNWDKDRKNVFNSPPRHTELKRSPSPEPEPYINNPAAVFPNWPPRAVERRNPGAVVPRAPSGLKPRTSVYGDLKLRELGFGAISRAFRRQAQCAVETSECGDSPGTCCDNT
jgi:hypothetical protein